MGGIADRLRLYERSSQPAPAVGPASVPRESLQFGATRLELHTPWVYRGQWEEDNPRVGTRSLRDYLPLGLSGIVELSLLSRPEAVHPEDVLFLDTETTGLTRGAGTLPFLTGLAYFRGESVILEQLFLKEPAGEDQYLAYLQEKFTDFEYIVSYNGRAFDVPLLRNRLILNRRQGLRELPHFDLLHIFRRLFPRGTLASYKQGELERELFEGDRDDDLPGAEIPQIYFDYVRYAHDAGMERVLEHNRRDVLGLVLLFLEAIRIYDVRDGSRAALRSGLARILVRNRRPDEAIALLLPLEDETWSPDESRLRYRDLLFLAQLYRTRGEFARSAALLARIIERYNCDLARLSLAKLKEHRLGDLSGALRLTESLLQSGLETRLPEGHERTSSEFLLNQGKRSIETHAELEHRRGRLLRKLGGQ